MTALTETPAPGTDAWQKLVSASKVAAILGISPWESPYSLWMTMTGRVPREEKDTPAIRRGNYLERGVIEWWVDQHPEIHDWGAQVPARLDDWAIATLDILATLDEAEDRFLICEVKTTSSWDEWGEPGTDAIPAHYYAQVLWQLACEPKAERGYVAVLGPFLDFREYVIERDQAVIDDLIRRCRAFYDSLSQDEPPDLDDHPATVATLRREHPDIAKGEQATVSRADAYAWLTAKHDLDAAQAAERAARARILNAARDAQYVTADGTRIARRQPSRYGISLVATAKADDLNPMENAS